MKVRESEKIGSAGEKRAERKKLFYPDALWQYPIALPYSLS